MLTIVGKLNLVAPRSICEIRGKGPCMEKQFPNHTVGGVSTRILLILQLSIVLLLLAACGHGIRSVWPDMGISTILPKPASKEIRIDLNREDCFRADIYDSSEKDYQAYTANCQKQGFTVDCEAAAAEYTAYNQDGFRLRTELLFGHPLEWPL